MSTICGVNLTALAPLPKGYPIAPITLGEHLRAHRMDFGYSAFELALELGVYESTIYKWEKGDSAPTPKHTQTIIEFMGYDPRLTQKHTDYELTEK